jgi:uncharacterized coiled-coil protein SlyX
MDKEEIVYWKWKNTIIDFDAISNETIDYNGYVTKKDYIFYYLGTPDRQIHEWYNGGFSSEYNSALIYARQLGLVENYVDYENKICELEQQVREQKEVIDRKKYLLAEQGAELKKIYSEIDKLQGRIDKAVKYLEAPNRDSFDYSKARILDILNEVSE